MLTLAESIYKIRKSAMLYIALLHYPVYNKEGKVVTTAIANMDIHDIARLAKTYGLHGFYVVNPVSAQRTLAQEIIDHWRQGYGATYNKSRKDAFEIVSLKVSLDEVRAEIAELCGHTPKTIVTSANFNAGCLTFSSLRKMLESNDLPYLLIFGTGSGIADVVIQNADYRLETIRGDGDYNHLAVRSAVAIILDRVVTNKK
jgi:hypothetical protein